MHRGTIPSLAALLLLAWTAPIKAQPAADRPRQAQNEPAAVASASHTSKTSLKGHRVVVLRVDEVIAADTGEGVDQQLLPMGPRLESLFRYTTYHLVSHQIGRTECGRQASFTLPGGWIVHVEPSAVRDNMIAMELMLFQGARPMMTTELRLRNRGMLIVGGPRYQQGMLIIPIGAEVPELSTPPAEMPIDPSARMPEMTAPPANAQDSAPPWPPPASEPPNQ